MGELAKDQYWHSIAIWNFTHVMQFLFCREEREEGLGQEQIGR
jgi:hypothetical protein